jgi:hypothetical protein
MGDPTAETFPPRLHPVILVVGKLWEAASKTGKQLRAEEVSLAHIERCCAKVQKKNGEYPLILTKMDFSEMLSEFEPQDLWWLPAPEAEEKGKGASLLHCLLML